ncbi:hypothetical protein BAUCODRAFT_31964 [Baudoinia panamericana UAMH 10762]|uniref:Stress response RCI peptide n=1 Tax=Baudoinia panamericana (strain UAMH 10762) TaxID=717646 RepID=M2LTU1_BAUPA|nr:uncharacterized protein BAUCODRAFT_31964 [Baudoinia panamericana UAMH 10762]EMC97952.1 hypothetical protein BAUCODRAFT_31964 [Baudoinia panamericana UAMH 10762]
MAKQRSSEHCLTYEQGSIILGVTAIVFPPLAVLFRAGCGVHFILNIGLLFLGWIPAILHAWWCLLEYPSTRERRRRRRREKEHYAAESRPYERRRSRSANSRPSSSSKHRSHSSGHQSSAPAYRDSYAGRYVSADPYYRQEMAYSRRR